MLGETEGRRRRGPQRMKQLDELRLAQENKVCLICLEYLKLFHKRKLFSLPEHMHSSYTLDGNFTSFSLLISFPLLQKIFVRLAYKYVYFCLSPSSSPFPSLSLFTTTTSKLFYFYFGLSLFYQIFLLFLSQTQS